MSSIAEFEIMFNNLTKFIITLKQTKRLRGIVTATSTHDKNIKIRPHVVASPLALVSAVIKKK